MTHLTEIPRADPVAAAPVARPAARQARPTEAQAPTTPMLRLISGNHVIAGALPDHAVQAMADELMARRALDVIDAAAERRKRKADAIVDALIANFVITGNPNHLWRADTIDAVLRDDLQSKGWRDVTPSDVFAVLSSLSDNATVPLALVFKQDRHIVTGLKVQGAAA